jgi:eukaryotic-like serine/threonine-protein kinase
MIGKTLSHYQITEELGEGGMGVVYKARDTHLDRFVAIKTLPPERVADPERKRRFIQEAKAASALNHPNIITIHDIDQAEGVDFIAMEYVDGRSLHQLMAGRQLDVGEVMSYAVEAAGALAAAHAAGIVHRDLKPANIMVAVDASGSSHVKLLDFGLAKLIQPLQENESAAATRSRSVTEDGRILGTVAYMSREQAEGKPVDARSDIFSFGSVLYEMLAGRRPFKGDSQFVTLMAIVREPPAPLKPTRKALPGNLERILAKCLEKDRERRYPSGRELWRDLTACQAQLSGLDLRGLLKRPRYGVPVVAALVLMLAGFSWLWMRNSRMRWARATALPQVQVMMDKGDYWGAFALCREVLRLIPDEPRALAIRRGVSWESPIITSPPGADVYVRDYDGPEEAESWVNLGRSPIQKALYAVALMRWRVQKEGYETLEVAGSFLRPDLGFTLQPRGSAPRDMVFMGAENYQAPCLPPVRLEGFWLDKHEVTNRQFKEFVGAGGYQKREYWKSAFVKDGVALSWDQAMTEFRDATGRPGPATWELGTYKEGQAEFPVGGVSWYEATAYAEFVGKSLPTVHHWYRATPNRQVAYEFVKLSNFDPSGPSPVGSKKDLGLYGTFDLAGNVREWCWNEAGSKRYILGGAWSDARHMFLDANALPPFDRAPGDGFRCAKYSVPLSSELAAPAERICRDYSREKSVTDEVFQAYRSLFAYDRGELNAKVDSVDDSSEYWRRERVSFDAAYGNERVLAHPFLPKNSSPPYQVVIHFPGGSALATDSSDNLYLFNDPLDFIVRSGRALAFPVLKGTFERRVKSGASGPNTTRERAIQRSKDLGRTIDYLETRRDTDAGKAAYYGYSWGAEWAPVMLAVEDRFKVGIVLAGGLPSRTRPPEVDPTAFAPRARQPVLMLNGRNDFVFPVETAQLGLLRLLGAPEKDKRHVIFDSGHTPPRQALVSEILDWLDKYLGPVQTR